MVHIWILALYVTTAASVDYGDLERLGAACSPRDTCKRRSKDFSDTSCECDRACLSYNDCCVDGPVPTRRNSPQKAKGLTCFPFLPDQGVYSVSSCSSSWSGSDDMRRSCEDEDQLNDPLMSIPATDTEAKVTYSSLYCAVCNDVSLASLSLWNVTLTCNSLSDITSDSESIMDKIARVDNSWGVYLGDTFSPCNLTFSVPPSAAKYVRYCRPNLVSTCAPDWNRESRRKDCSSYMGVVYISGQAYRNVHCALCNHASVDNRKCLPGASVIRTTWLSFPLILDIYRKNSENSDGKDVCSSGQIYDPFATKCRRLMCRLPGHFVRNGECVQN